jgi:O-antigen/teichoic acid export membrane protein
MHAGRPVDATATSDDSDEQERARVLGRSVVFNMLGQGGSLLVGFVASILLARWLGPSDRGLLGIMVSTNGLALAVLGLGIAGAAHYYASLRETRLNALLGDTLAYGVVLGAIVVPAVWLLRDPIAELLSKGRGADAWVLAAVLVPVSFVQFTTQSHLGGGLRFGLLNVLWVVSKLVQLVLVVVLLGFLGLGVSAALVCLIVASLVITCGGLPAALARSGFPTIDLGLFRQLLAYGLRSQAAGLFRILNFRLDVIILQFFQPLAVVGYYVVAQVIAELVITLSRSFQPVVLTLVARREGEERRSTTVAAVRHHGILALAAVLGNAVLGSLVIVYGFGPDFRDAVVPMLILLPGMWFLGTGTLIGSDLSGRQRPGLASVLAGLAVLVTVGLDLLLIPPFGATGAAVASLGAYVVFGIASLIALSRLTGVSVPTLVVPERSDLGLYWRAVRRGAATVLR